MCHVASAINNKRALFHATVQPSPATKTSFKSKLVTAQFHKYFKQQNALTGTLLPIKKHKLNVILLIKPGPKTLEPQLLPARLPLHFRATASQ